MNTDLAVNDLAARFGLSVDFRYRHALRGMAVRIPDAFLRRLEQDPRVACIEAVQAMHLHAQVLPTGVDRINVELNATASIVNVDDGVDVDIAVIDSGVDIDHPDLDVWRYVYCYPKNPISGTCSENDIRADDTLGHGTHVAGIAAARGNTTGVAGVALGARIRVEQDGGFMYTREITAAPDYVAANSCQIEVASMSLGLVGSSGVLDQAIASTVASGVTTVVSAGNEALDASLVSPPAILT